MIPMRTSSVFKSRWMALIWAAGILWTAYDFAGAQPQPKSDGNNAVAEEQTDAAGETVTPDDEQRLKEAIDKF